jgi:predicted dehydrogenase
LKFLIAGLGSIGRRHLQNLLALGQRDIVLFRTHQGTLSDPEIEAFPTETNLSQALDQRPDAVIVSNPTALHLDVAIPAAEAGCHLFLEKPVSHSMDRIPDLVKAVELNGVKVLTGFQFRFHPGLACIKQCLGEEAIGKPISIRAHWGEHLPSWHPWEDYRIGYSARADLGGGVTLTLCHPLDYLRWLLGEVAALWAFSSHSGNLDIEVEDSVEIGLKFLNGALGSVHLDYIQRPPSHHLTIIGTNGTIEWDNSNGNARFYRVDKGEWEDHPVPSGFERNDLFMTEMSHFLDVLEGKSEPACTLDDGLRALELALSACISQKQAEIIQW